MSGLTYERMLEMQRGAAFFAAMSVITIPYPMVTLQARRHPRKKRRLQKKWLRRYGTVTVIDPALVRSTCYYDRLRGILYCYEEGARLIRQYTTELARDQPANLYGLTGPAI